MTQRNNFLITLVVLAGVLVLHAARTRAAELVLEEYSVPGDYADVTPLNDIMPTGSLTSIGFDPAIAWNGNLPDISGGKYETVATGLMYATGGPLLTSDGSVRFSRMGTGFVESPPKYIRRTIAMRDPLGSATSNSTFWCSALIEFDPQLEKTIINFPIWRGDLSERYGFDLNFGFWNGALALLYWTTPSVIATSQTVYASNTTHLVVCKFTQGSPDVWQGWVDPDLSLGEGGLGAPAHSISPGVVYNDGMVLSQLMFSITCPVTTADEKVSRFDEVRVGLTYQDVTPLVPEPVGLIVLGVAALLRRR